MQDNAMRSWLLLTSSPHSCQGALMWRGRQPPTKQWQGRRRSLSFVVRGVR